MSVSQKRILLLDTALLAFIPLLFLFQRNAAYLSFAQVLITCAALALVTIVLFFLCRAILRSNTAAFFSCLFFIILIFAANGIYSFFWPNIGNIVFLMPFPLSYAAGYLYIKIVPKKELEKLPVLACVGLMAMLLMNVFPIITRTAHSEPIEVAEYEAKVDSATPSPNVYWFLCDGMLGFDAMEQYFGDSQEELTQELTDRGFAINKSAAFESGHWTRIAIPALMCPHYYDEYLQEALSDHENAVAMREQPNLQLDDARVNNETILSFREKGYTTATISISGPYFYQTTNFYYYIDARFKTPRDYESVPRLVENLNPEDTEFSESRLYAYQLGEVFLGGIPGKIYDYFFSKDNLAEEELKTDFDGTSDVLLGSDGGKINYALVESLYDAIHSPDISAPKFVIVHDFLAHYPFDLDENGNKVTDDKSIWSYPGQHTYAGKVLVNLIDMVLEADPNAVIVLQADHGLHEMTLDQITQAFGADAALDIWNSVFSAIRVPEQYLNGDEHYALSNPLNLSRYLINSFVGLNDSYLTK